ncbi:hypothetical protein HWV62_8505 [Athelia sp. TMB]|nr:hypothetical protein HWV62_8505 [Athelia sp. TMB]
MPNLRLAWVPLTVVVTIAIYLHLRGFPGSDTANTPVSPPVEPAPLAKTEELISEETSADEACAHPGQKISHLVTTFVHLVSASPGARAAPTDETATSPSRSAANWQVTLQRPEIIAELPAVLHQKDLAKANALKDKSAALLDLGQRQEALTAIAEATDLFRALASKHPAFNAELALSLRVLSPRLGDAGQREEALSAIEEAVELHRALANEQPVEFNIELASSLNHLSNRLSRLDRHEEALLAIHESVDLYRTTAEDQPKASRPGLAASLYNLSNRLSRYDLREEALIAIQEASNIYQRLAAETPLTYERNLRLCLTKLSGLNGAGRGEDLEATGDAAGLKDVVPPRRTPDDAVVLPSAGESTARRRDPLASASDKPSDAPVYINPIFNITGQLGGTVNNVVGDYITVDEDSVTKISRLLPYTEGASWDPQRTCLPGTRLPILSAIGTWARRRVSEQICLLEGVAGSGKTAISHTIAEILRAEGLLATAFFFSRDDASRNTPKTLLATMARDIASLHPRAAEAIAEALEAEPALASASLSRQFDALILEPCRHLPTDRTTVFIIDALDESISHDLDTELLMILRDKFTQLPPHVRILITSRPTSIIEQYLSRCSHVVAHSIDVHSVENKGDIDMYVDTQLRDEALLHKMGLTSPDEVIISDLKHLAEGLFVWIVTVCNFLRTAYKPKEKLQALLSKSSQQGSPPEKKMDQLYGAILAECGDWEDSDFVKDYDLVMGTIMALKRPLSLAALWALHDGSQDLEAEQLLQRFGSVLVGFRDPHQPIRILHLSFREFITDRAAKDDSTKHFYLSEKGHSGRLAELCVKTLNRELAKPIAGSGYLAVDTLDAGIPKILDVSEQLVYGCAHWSSHLQDVEIPQTIQAHLITLISRHLVTWIEVLAATDIFRGSLQIKQWVQQRVPELEHHFQHESQANALSVLGNRLGYAARMEESLLTTKEGVILFRTLARKRPAMYSGVLARCLNNLSCRLSDLGRAQEALSAVEEAVNLRRALAAERPAAYNADLASSLGNLSNRLSALGRAQEALSAVQEAVNLRRALAAERPAAYNADLATSLSNLSNHLSALGRAQEALLAVEESVHLRRALAAERPAAYNAALATSLTNLSGRLLDLGRAQEALSVVEEAVNLYRPLAAERPAVYNADLASSLSNLSVHLSALGRAQEALSPVEEAVDLRRALAAERPAAYNADLASDLNNLSNCLSILGRGQEALSAVEESVHLKRARAAERPAAYNADLAMGLGTLSNRLSELGRRQEALSAVEEAASLHRVLAAERPAAYNSDLAKSLGNLSNRLSELGRTQEALSAAQETAILFRSLATERPAAYDAYLAQSLRALSLRLTDLGRQEEALMVMPEAVELCRALAAEQPAQFNEPLMRSLIMLSNAMVRAAANDTSARAALVWCRHPDEEDIDSGNDDDADGRHHQAGRGSNADHNDEYAELKSKQSWLSSREYPLLADPQPSRLPRDPRLPPSPQFAGAKIDACSGMAGCPIKRVQGAARRHARLEYSVRKAGGAIDLAPSHHDACLVSTDDLGHLSRLRRRATRPSLVFDYICAYTRDIATPRAGTNRVEMGLRFSSNAFRHTSSQFNERAVSSCSAQHKERLLHLSMEGINLLAW